MELRAQLHSHTASRRADQGKPLWGHPSHPEVLKSVPCLRLGGGIPLRLCAKVCGGREFSREMVLNCHRLLAQRVCTQRGLKPLFGATCAPSRGTEAECGPVTFPGSPRELVGRQHQKWVSHSPGLLLLTTLPDSHGVGVGWAGRHSQGGPRGGRGPG